MSQLAYRKELDGLRGIAVLAAIFFHAGMHWCSGGFVGVDMFFVLSGYLMAAIIVREKQAGTFSLWVFYERRLRRILPALLVTICACVPAAWYLMPPRLLEDFFQSVITALLFIPKAAVWPAEGYFDVASYQKPLLHLWSLTVEAQFYLLFPLLLLACLRMGRKFLVAAVAILLVASLAEAQRSSAQPSVLHFYLFSTRAWELLAGALIAFYECWHGRKGSRALRYVISGVGMAMLGYAIVMFNPLVPFPSIYTALPVAGTMCLIFALGKDMFLARVLGSSWLAGVGVVSYSAYLWHQPLFVFARLYMPSPPGPLHYWGLTLLALGIAAASWKWVEQPLRNRRLVAPAKMFLLLVPVWTLLMVAGIAGQQSEGFKDSYALPKSVEESFVRSPRQKECFAKDNIHDRPDWLCDIGSEDNPISFMLYGDSHALSLLPAFEEKAMQMNLHGVFTGTHGCPPLLLIHTVRADSSLRNCHALNQRVYDYVKAHQIKKLYLTARWAFYVRDTIGVESEDYLSLTKEGAEGFAMSRQAFEVGLAETIRQYNALGVELVIFAQVPRQKADVQQIYHNALSRNPALFNSNLHARFLPRGDHEQWQSTNRLIFAPYANEEKIRFIVLDDVFCDAQVCRFGSDKLSYYYDDDHLSVAGSLLLKDKIPMP